jgi:D-sedoheptulose 7-phosphate isomerase
MVPRRAGDPSSGCNRSAAGPAGPVAHRKARGGGEQVYTVVEPAARNRTVDTARRYLGESAAVTTACLDTVADQVAAASQMLLDTLGRGGKIVLFGNGGSAADAQHMAADLVGKFMRDREPVPAVALAADTAVLTALGNDYGFDLIFARQVDALVHEGDAVVAISTSGRSRNIIEGAAAARRAGACVIALTGRDGSPLTEAADVAIRVPSDHIGHIQEAHIAIGHALCALIEEAQAADAKNAGPP